MIISTAENLLNEFYKTNDGKIIKQYNTITDSLFEIIKDNYDVFHCHMRDINSIKNKFTETKQFINENRIIIEIYNDDNQKELIFIRNLKNL